MPKRILRPYQLVADQALAGNYTSPATSIEYLDRCALKISVTGTPTGTLALEGSVDGGLSYSDLKLGLAALAGAGNDYVIDMVQTALTHVRVAYTHTSGSGTMNVWITGKES